MIKKNEEIILSNIISPFFVGPAAKNLIILIYMSYITSKWNIGKGKSKTLDQGTKLFRRTKF